MSETRTVDVVNASGKKAGKVDLPGAIFDVQTNIPLIHQVVVAQLAAARQGTASTKTRGEVRGGGIKPWRQKGTGRARQGSRRAPQWAGGGVVHGPQPRDYAQRTPKKMIAAALRAALSDRARDGQVYVASEFVTGETPNTKAALATLNAFGDLGKTLIVLDRFEDVAWMSLRNVADVHVIAVDQLNTYDVVNSDAVIFTAAALAAFVNGPATSVEALATESEAAEFVEEISAEKPLNAAPKAAAKSTKVAKVAAVTEEPKADEAEEPKAVDGVYRGTEAPAGYDIKGNADSGKYHTPGSPWYDRTIAEVWFNSTEAAEAAGFVAAVQPKEEDEK